MLSNSIGLFIKRVNVVDVEKECVSRDVDILIKHGRILEVGTLSYPDAEVAVEASGLWAIPSLVDMHAHVTFEGRAHWMSAFNPEERGISLIARGAQNLIEALGNGVCLIRDAGDNGAMSLSLKRLVDEGSIVGPTLVLSGQPLCCQGGHGHEFSRPLMQGDAIESLVRNHRHQGYDWLKIMNGPELHDLSVLKEIVYWSHQYDLKVMCHAFTQDGIRDAVISGVDTVEHGLVFDEETGREARNRGTVFVPTCYSAWASMEAEYTDTISSTELQHLKDWRDFLQAHFAFNVSSGVIIGTGTDGGAAPSTPSDISNEVKSFCHYGMRPIQAIKSSTIIPAQVLGKADDFGSIAKGKLANIILLSEDPTTRIDALDSVVAIYYCGAKIVQREVTLGIERSNPRALGTN